MTLDTPFAFFSFIILAVAVLLLLWWGVTFIVHAWHVRRERIELRELQQRHQREAEAFRQLLIKQMEERRKRPPRLRAIGNRVIITPHDTWPFPKSGDEIELLKTEDGARFSVLVPVNSVLSNAQSQPEQPFNAAPPASPREAGDISPVAGPGGAAPST